MLVALYDLESILILVIRLHELRWLSNPFAKDIPSLLIGMITGPNGLYNLMVKVFFVFVQSPEQVKSSIKVKKVMVNKPGINLFLVTRFKLEGQPQYSRSQYSKALSKLKGFNTVIIPESIMSRLFPVLLKNTFLTKKFSFIIGNFSEYYGRNIYENLLDSEIIVVDDGADVISASMAVAKENKHSNLSFFSKYAVFMHPKYRNSMYELEKPIMLIHQTVSSEVLGVLGGPYVELEGLSLNTYEELVIQIMNHLGCKEVYYFMHRRENKKFTSPQIYEFIDSQYSSVELLDKLQILPASYWSFTSSALLDVFLKYDMNSSLKFFYSEPIFSRKLPKFFSERKVDSNQNILETFKICGFHEIQTDPSSYT